MNGTQTFSNIRQIKYIRVVKRLIALLNLFVFGKEDLVEDLALQFY